MSQQAFEHLVESAKKEILAPSLAVAEQLLNACSVEMDGNGPRVVHVDHEPDGQLRAYFRVRSECHFVVINIDQSTAEPLHAWMENGHELAFYVISEEYTFHELKSRTTLPTLSGHSKGDVRPASTRTVNGMEYRVEERLRPNSVLCFQPSANYWDDFEPSLAQLFSDLEQDIDGVVELGKLANAKICVTRHQARMANSGYILSRSAIFRLNRLGLCLEIDQYISGQWSDD